MNRYFFMRPVLDKLTEPAFFGSVIAVALRVVASLIGLLSLTVFFKAGKLTFDLPAEHAVGGVLFEVYFVLAVFATIQVLLIRASEIETPKMNDTYAISTVALMIKLLGEMYCVFVGLVAMGGGLFVWFTNQGLEHVLGPVIKVLMSELGGDPSFMGGIEFMAVGVFLGLAVLIGSYAASQALLLLVRPSSRTAAGHTAPVEVSHTHTQSYRSRFGS
jgi:hypothetical protein